ncbi:MAG: M28 family peptidase [Dehalococcoidia bacterium]
MPFLRRRAAATLLLASLAVALLGGCRGGTRTDAASATPTTNASPATSAVATATPTSVATPPARSTPEAARAMAHLRRLAGEIGPRAATTDGERRAAEYIRGELERAGYRVSIEPFEVDVATGGTATLRPDGAPELRAAPMGSAPDATASGPVAAVGGLGSAQDFAAVSVRGAVAVVDRGTIPFAEKARNAQQAGAVALVVVNNQAGLFRGDLGSAGVTIPVIGVAQEDGAALRALAGVRATVTSSTQRLRGTSQNVVGRPSGGECTAYLGGHYDSVAAGPGANDNASGTSLLLELARARRNDGVCVIAFGGEEEGLLGSRAYARTVDITGARFMLNFDMVAKHTRPSVIGDQALAERASRLAQARGLAVSRLASIGPGAASDHATFQQAGVPVLMFYAGDDQFIHTAQDDVANTSEADLAKFLDLAVALLDELTGR